MSVFTVESVSHAVAGATGGVIAMGALYPLENIRCRMQVQAHQKSLKRGVDVDDGDDYKDSVDCLIRIVREEGWTKLYAGLNSALVGVAVSSSIYFFWYSALKSLVLQRTERRSLSPAANLCVASVAGALNVFVTLPLWTINTRLAIQSKRSAVSERYSSTLECVRRIWADEGLSAFWHGLIPSLILVSNPAIQFLVYEQMVKWLTRRQNGQNSVRQLTNVEYFVVGAFSKAVATIVSYPYQVLKSRQQAHKNADQSTWKTLLQMYNEEGFSSLWRGMGAKLIQTVLNSAFMFVTYENILRTILVIWKDMGFQISATEIQAHHSLKPTQIVQQEDVKEIATVALTMSDENTPATVGQSVAQAANSAQQLNTSTNNTILTNGLQTTTPSAAHATPNSS